jgi:hypothetical protein
MAFPAKLGLVLVSVLSARAQLLVSARAGLIDYSQGLVNLDAERLRTGVRIRQMEAGQTLSTGIGRVEVLLAPAITMRLGDNTSIRFGDTRLEDTQVYIEKGSAFIEVVEMEKDARLRVFLGDSETEFRRNGLYRFESLPARLRVYGGDAAVLRQSAQIAARRGQAIDLRTLDLSEFDMKIADPLHTWAAKRSFALFNSSIETRRKQKHWEYLGDGWVFNKNFGIKYRSTQARRDNSWIDQQLRRAPAVPRADSRD